MHLSSNFSQVATLRFSNTCPRIFITDSLTHSPTHSFTTHSFTHSLTCLLDGLTNSLKQTHCSGSLAFQPIHTHIHSRTSCMTQRLQRYEINAPVSWVATPESSFEGLESLGTEHPNVKVTGAGTLRLDYGREVRFEGWPENSAFSIYSEIFSPLKVYNYSETESSVEIACDPLVRLCHTHAWFGHRMSHTPACGVV